MTARNGGRRAPQATVHPSDGPVRSVWIHFHAATRESVRLGLPHYEPADVKVNAYRSPSDRQPVVEISEVLPGNLHVADPLVALGALATITIKARPCEDNPADHFEDPEQLAHVRRQIDAGSLWGWCNVIVRASLGPFQGIDSLCACSYGGEEDFRHPGGYYDDMVRLALEGLYAEIAAAER